MEILKNILLLALIVTIAVVSYVAFQKADRYMNIVAVHDCAQDYRMTVTDEATHTVKNRPMEQQVRECAWNKGVRNWNGVWSDLIKK